MPIIELSSTDLRQRASSGKSLRYRTPRAIEKYIETQGLYR
jgi:nicotinate-nucleotide adenylyltransferase